MKLMACSSARISFYCSLQYGRRQLHSGRCLSQNVGVGLEPGKFTPIGITSMKDSFFTRALNWRIYNEGIWCAGRFTVRWDWTAADTRSSSTRTWRTWPMMKSRRCSPTSLASCWELAALTPLSTTASYNSSPSTSTFLAMHVSRSQPLSGFPENCVHNTDWLAKTDWSLSWRNS